MEKVSSDRAARAVLKRTLGREIGEVPGAFRYVLPWLPEKCSERTENVYYLVAGLYAYHPQHTGQGNMGAHLRDLSGGDADAMARLEKRLIAALRAHPDDLPDHLRRLVGILKAKEKPINWHTLMGDLLYWDQDDFRVQKRWASAFWNRITETNQIETNPSIETLAEEKE
jgi:CRISPR system Cascade subunit CasB